MSLPFGGAPEPREISEINVVPLADVSLVLLILLLVLSPMMEQRRLAVRADAARAGGAGAPLPAQPDARRAPDVVFVVGLSSDRVTVGEQVFSDGPELRAYLAGALAARAERKVFLAPRPDVAHGRVVETIELLKSAGAESVALVQSLPEDVR